MKRRIISLFVLAAMLLCLLAACDSNSAKTITQDEAKTIALEEVGLSEKDVDDIHVHIGNIGDTVCYNIHITVGDQEYEVAINAATGEVVE